MTYRNDLDAAHARIEALERENRALEQALAHRPTPTVIAAPLAMQPVRRSPIELGHFIDAVRLAIVLFILLHVLAR